MVKKILIVLIIVTLTLGVLAGCNRREVDKQTHDMFLEVLPEAKNFTKVDVPKDVPPTVQEIYCDTNNAGYVIKVVTKGYKDGLTILVGISSHGLVTGAMCLSSNESYGAEKDYGTNFIGKDKFGVAMVDLVSGATLTTKAYSNAIYDAFSAYEKIKSGISIGDSEEFDYLTFDLSEYLEFTDDYKNFTVEVDIARPKNIDIDTYILMLLASDKNQTPVVDSTNTVIGPGDVVEMYYKGYIFDEKGDRLYLDEMSNFNSAKPYKLEIGSGAFIPGFELGLVGIDVSNHASPIVIETYFPYDYPKKDLRNKTAYFEINIEKFTDYSCEYESLCDEYLVKKIENGELNVTLKELEEYGKDSIVENFYVYVEQLLYYNYEITKRAMTESEIWNYYLEIAKVLKYPKSKVDEVYEDYVNDIFDWFVNDGGSIYNSATGQYVTYKTFDEFAPIYLGLGAGGDWKAEVYKQSESFIKERMVMFYILRAENLLPSEEELMAERDEIFREYLDDAIKQYLSYHGTTREDYTDEEYEEVVEECRDIVFFNFEENYFIIRAYFNILAEEAVKWPTVITLDEM